MATNGNDDSNNYVGNPIVNGAKKGVEEGTKVGVGSAVVGGGLLTAMAFGIGTMLGGPAGGALAAKGMLGALGFGVANS